MRSGERRDAPDRMPLSAAGAQTSCLRPWTFEEDDRSPPMSNLGKLELGQMLAQRCERMAMVVFRQILDHDCSNAHS